MKRLDPFMEAKISSLDCYLIRLQYWDGQALITWVLYLRQDCNRFVWFID